MEETSNLESVDAQFRQRSGLDELEKKNKADARAAKDEAKAAPKADTSKSK